MVMSQGTSTFLACFAGFWLVWAVVVMLCCFCSFLQRRLKRRRDDRLREQCPRSAETLGCRPAAFTPPPAPAPPPLPREPPRSLAPPPHTLAPPPLLVPHPLPQATWVSMPVSDADLLGKPPCYEDAVLMEDPPPPYSEVLADPRGGTFLEAVPFRPAAPPLGEAQDPPPVSTSVTSKLQAGGVFPGRGYSSLIHLPSSLGQFLSNMDLSHAHLTPPTSLQAAAMATMPRREPRTQHVGIQGLQGFQGELQVFQGLRGAEPGCGLPTAFPLLGRTTAV